MNSFVLFLLPYLFSLDTSEKSGERFVIWSLFVSFALCLLVPLGSKAGEKADPYSVGFVPG